MRVFFFLLVLVNLVFFAWAQGYFGQSDEGHEPERLNQQLHADKLRIARLDGAPAKAEEQACRLVGGLKPADAESLKATADAGLGGQSKILTQKPPTLYLVLIGDLPNKALADKKIAELTRFGVDASSAVALEGGRHEIILGSFPGEAGAGGRLPLLGLEDHDLHFGPSRSYQRRLKTSQALRNMAPLMAPRASACRHSSASPAPLRNRPETIST